MSPTLSPFSKNRTSFGKCRFLAKFALFVVICNNGNGIGRRGVGAL